MRFKKPASISTFPSATVKPSFATVKPSTATSPLWRRGLSTSLCGLGFLVVFAFLFSILPVEFLSRLSLASIFRGGNTTTTTTTSTAADGLPAGTTRGRGSIPGISSSKGAVAAVQSDAKVNLDDEILRNVVDGWVDMGGFEIVWQKGRRRTKGLIFLAHGCKHRPQEFWHHWTSRCPSCSTGLPVENRIARKFTTAGYHVLAMAPVHNQNNSQCWHRNDRQPLAQSIQYIYRLLQTTVDQTPLYALGITNGGVFLGNSLASMDSGYGLRFSAMALMNAGVWHTNFKHGNFPPTLYVDMNRNSELCTYNNETVYKMRAEGVDALQLSVEPVPIHAEYFSSTHEYEYEGAGGLVPTADMGSGSATTSAAAVATNVNGVTSVSISRKGKQKKKSKGDSMTTALPTSSTSSLSIAVAVKSVAGEAANVTHEESNSYYKALMAAGLLWPASGVLLVDPIVDRHLATLKNIAMSAMPRVVPSIDDFTWPDSPIFQLLRLAWGFKETTDERCPGIISWFEKHSVNDRPVNTIVL